MASFGEDLRRQRELREIALEEIAEATKVNLRFLEAMERNDFDALPGGLFTRGFIRAYAEHVGLDPEATVNAYLYQIEEDREGRDRQAARGPRLQVAEGSGRGARALPRPVLAAAAGLAILMLAWWLLPRGAGDADGEAAVATGHVLQVAARRDTAVTLACGETNVLEETMTPDRPATVRCEGEFRLTAANPADLALVLDGVEVVPPPGEPLSGWPVRPARGEP